MYVLSKNLPSKGFIMNSDKQQAKKEQEEDSLYELTSSKLDAVWNDVKFLKKLLTRMSELESDKAVLWCLYAFSAARGAELGQTKEEFLESIGAAFDDVTEDGDEEEEEMPLDYEDLPPIDLTPHADDSDATPTEEE
jgi:hypothetical protein